MAGRAWCCVQDAKKMASMSNYKCSHCPFQGESLMGLLNHICLNGPSQAAANTTLYFVPEQPSASSQPSQPETVSSALYFVPEQPSTSSQPSQPEAMSSALYFVPEQPSTSSQASAAVYSTSTAKKTSTDPDKLDRWEEKDVRLLITCFADHQHMFGGKAKKKDIFNKIAKAFNETAQHVVSGEQCMRKWAKLFAKHKEVEDHNHLTGRSKKKWKYSDKMSACLENNAAVCPVVTIESSGTSVEKTESECNESSLNDESNDCNEAESDIDSESDSSSSKSSNKKKKVNMKRQRKKRKSRSSASEMLDFLKEYSDRREKVEEEKLKLFKEMKEEKKNFFDKFFDFM